jgi:indolepyruvate ferredoxin oxidoreductase
VAGTTTREFHLGDRLAAEAGTVAMSGIDALLRVLVDQHRADAARGLRTATLLTGYRGSPVGGLDMAYRRSRELLEAHGVTFLNGVNEELAATAVFGSQIANTMADVRYDGVLGMWYGKSPGVDRSGDAIRHGNFAGVGRNGGVLCVAGDDPSSKSSTLPSQSELAFFDLALPILYPGSVQEIVDLGRWGYELSRASGLWCGFKVTTDVADAYETIEVGPDRVAPAALDPSVPVWDGTVQVALAAPFSLELERSLFEQRLVVARMFSRANGLDRVTVSGGREPWLGIVAPGKAYYEVREGLARLGLGEDDLDALGIRVFKPAMVFPLDEVTVRRFARGLEEVVVVEEKRPFLEAQVKEALYGLPAAPRVVGKDDDAGAPLVPRSGALDADIVAGVLRRRLLRRIPEERLAPSLVPRLSIPVTASPPPGRLPFYCSGCPHNRSTAVPEGSVAGGGIGCHGMSLLMPQRLAVGLVQMGGEGVQWVGASPFVETEHRFQNLGDGTFFHSGSLAIRQAVAAGTNVTFKLLYNGVVAMTGGQQAAGEMPVPELTRLLEAEGVVRTVVLSDDPKKYGRRAGFARNVTVRPRQDLDAVQRQLREVPGVTVLVYDQACAAELRRARKRGLVETPKRVVVIDEAVCEGCGDCARVSNCASVHPVDTPFGRKTQVHQQSCNRDYSCVEGNCPSFVTFEVRERRNGRRRGTESEAALPEPTVQRSATVLLVGIGGTGVVTVNQVLATAATLDGKHAIALDQTGLSQKGGTVTSNLKVTEDPLPLTNKVTAAGADVLLGFDVLAAASDLMLTRLDAERTVAVVSTSRVPTGPMVVDGSLLYPDESLLRARIDACTRAERNRWLDAERVAAEHDLGPAVNTILLGMASQLGVLPVTPPSLEKAIELNGVAVESNLRAFRLGRRLVVEGGAAAGGSEADEGATALDPRVAEIVGSTGVPGALRPPLALRVADLIAYQNVAYARRYAARVAGAWAAEQRAGGSGAFTDAVVRSLHKLMAYKDEYEVARLHLAAGRRPGAVKVRYHLQPPLLKKLGLRRKIALGASARMAFRALAASRRLRGTPFDPFGHDHVRRVERGLRDRFEEVVDDLCRGLSADNLALATEVAALPDAVRGYDEVKLANVARYQARLAELLEQLGREGNDTRTEDR